MTSRILENPLPSSEKPASVSQTLTHEQRDFVERLKRLYKADHQAEYLYIQAEVDSLWIQLEQAKARHQVSV